MKKGYSKLNVFQKNQYKIACRTMNMTKEMDSVMGGMTLAEAKAIKSRLERKMKD